MGLITSFLIGCKNCITSSTTLNLLRVTFVHFPSTTTGTSIMQQSTSRPSRRPFGPRLQPKELESTTATSPESHHDIHASASGVNVLWVVPPNDPKQNSSTPSQPPPRMTRPLPQVPRNIATISAPPLPTQIQSKRPIFNFTQTRRPLPSSANAAAQDVPFAFSSRTSQYVDIHAPGKLLEIRMFCPLTTILDPIKDPFGSQTGISSDAAIWQSYMEEAQRQNKNIVSNWNQSMDVILIFVSYFSLPFSYGCSLTVFQAGLFSAILTAFLIEFYRLLQPDPQHNTVDQLVIITQILQASMGQNGLNVSSPALVDPSFKPLASSVGLNILWFTSLTCSLGTAIGAMVIKQWLQFYTMDLSTTAYEYVHQHQYRYNALVAWHVPSIVSALPFIMLISVGLFLVGLGLQLWQINVAVASAVIGFMAVIFLCYWLSLALSIIYPACPYKTSAMVLLHSIFHSVHSIFGKLFHQASGNHLNFHDHQANAEIRQIRKIQPELVVNGIAWLLGVSQKEDTIHHALTSVSQLQHTPDMITKLQNCNALEQIAQRAHIPLPALDHEFWQELKELTPEHAIFRKCADARVYMHTLITVWHHPSYFSQNRPPAVSEQQNSERYRTSMELMAQFDKKGMKEANAQWKIYKQTDLGMLYEPTFKLDEADFIICDRFILFMSSWRLVVPVEIVEVKIQQQSCPAI